MITVRKAEDIYQAQGEIENGTFTGRWHFSFGEYYDPRYIQFGTLRDAAMIVGEPGLHLKAQEDAELLFVVVGLK